MGNNGSCPVYDGPGGNFVRVDAVACGACPRESTGDSWLIFHLVLSFVLVAYVRWSRVVVHNHACNQRGLPECCRQHLQQLEEVVETVKKEVEVLTEDRGDRDAKENEEEERAAARLASLRTEYAPYLQMLKVKLPRAVVDHKMRAENKDSAVLDELIATTPRAKKLPAPIEIPEDPERTRQIESFQRMIKVGVPRHVVEMKARREGVDPAELKRPSASSAAKLKPEDSELALPATRSRRSSISSAASTAPSTPDAVAMRAASTVAASNGRTLAMLALRKMNTGMRKKLHWSTTAYTGALVPVQRRDSLWSRIHAKDKQDRVCISRESRRWMEKLFVKVVAKAKAGRRRRTNSGNSATPQKQQPPASSRSEMEERERASSDPTVFDEELDELEAEPDPEDVDAEVGVAAKAPGSAFLHRKLYVVLLDHKKSQNIAIVLARVKRSFPELTHEILTLNCNVLSSPALQSLIDMWPDSDEQEAIDQFEGDASSLATAEQFLMVARKIPRAQQKLRCLQFKMDFAPRVEELRDNLNLMIRGIQQVCASDRFAGVLEYIFHLGNLLNFGEGVEYTEWVKSISISSLAKLSFTKAYDGRISFLQYVIQSIERDEPHLALFSEQLPLITKCSKLSIQSLVTEHQSLLGGLGMLINETQKVAVFKTDDDDLRGDLAQSRESMRLYTMEVEQELNGVQELVNQLERERKQFLNYFEEEDTLPIDELLGFIATFADEYTRERQQLILRARQKKTANHFRSASVNTLPQKRHSLSSIVPPSVPLKNLEFVILACTFDDLIIATSSLTSQVSIEMPSLVAVVVGVGVCFILSFDEGELVEALAKTFVEKSKQQLDPCKVAFFPAKRSDEWLSAQDVDALKQGKVPMGVKAAMSSRNRMDPKVPVSSCAFGLQDADSATKVHVLVDVPENIKRDLRYSFAGQISFNKMMYYHELLWPLDSSSWLCGVIAFILGGYLYSYDENLVRGVVAACDPASGKLMSVGIPGVLMWILAAAAVVLAAAKDHFQRKSRDHQQRLDSMKIAQV